MNVGIENKLPKLFIGSSVEGLEIARAIQLELEHDAETIIWNQDVFKPSSGTIDDLLSRLNDSDFGIFVFSPDDIASIREQEYRVPRDNVILETGLFIGRIGKERTFYLIPRGETRLHLPTDLTGINPLDYDPNKSNLQSAIGAACSKIRRRLSELGKITAKLQDDTKENKINPSSFTARIETENVHQRIKEVQKEDQKENKLNNFIQLNIDDGIIGEEVNSFFSNLGVKFSNAIFAETNDIFGSAKIAITSSREGGPTSLYPIAIEFDKPIIHFSYGAADLSGHGFHMSCFDENRNMIGGSGLQGQFGNATIIPKQGYGVTATNRSIKRVELFQPQNTKNEEGKVLFGFIQIG